jgi:pimeloyl-ACP methyl ester carboxylesterase
MTTGVDVMVTRADHYIQSTPEIAIAVREVRPLAPRPDQLPLLLVHGGGGGGVASFDVPVPGYSLAAAFAEAGIRAFAIDIRGWGTSTRPPELEGPADAAPPAVNSDEAVQDIAAAVEWILRHTGQKRIDLFGWATGGHWAAMYASRQPARVRALISLNSLYGVDAPWPMRDAFADPDDPARFDRAIGAYALRTAQSLLGGWERSIPIEDRDEWRDPRVAEAYAAATITSDPTSSQREPPSVRTPTGFQRDSFAQASGAQFWDAGAITAKVLIARGTLDFWSRREDVLAFRDGLTNAQSVETLEIDQGTHFLFIDRPERGAAAFLDAAIRFLQTP